MADHYVSLHSQEESHRLLDFLNDKYPPDKMPFSITAKQDQAQAGHGSSDGEDQTIRIQILGIGANAAHTPQYSATYSGDPDSTFQTALTAIDQAVDAWYETERNQQTLPPYSSTQA